jgi:heme A synthase
MKKIKEILKWIASIILILCGLSVFLGIWQIIFNYPLAIALFCFVAIIGLLAWQLKRTIWM